MKSIARLFVLLIAASSISSIAALYDRGNGMIYDSDQNITWLQDANYPFTSGHTTVKKQYMTWQEAKAWAENLVYAGYDDWRLPSAKLNANYNVSCTGSTNLGANNTRSELGHLFYIGLNNKGGCDVSGNNQKIAGLRNIGFIDGATNETRYFINFDYFQPYDNDQSDHLMGYWLLERYPLYTGGVTSAFYFDMDNGVQVAGASEGTFIAIAVRNGDVAQSPLPPILDADQDGFVDPIDTCPSVVNVDQRDGDKDRMGDACDDDDDGDGVVDMLDNCPNQFSQDITDSDGDGMGDPCDGDNDNDGIANFIELMNGLNPFSGDSDGDGIADGIDRFPLDSAESKDKNDDGIGDNRQIAELNAQIKSLYNSTSQGVYIERFINLRALAKDAQEMAEKNTEEYQLILAKMAGLTKKEQAPFKKQLKNTLKNQKKYLKAQKKLIKQSASLAKKNKFSVDTLRLAENIESKVTVLTYLKE